MRQKLISLIISLTTILASGGGYDHGTAAGKGNFDISLTWNPFNYFKQGQTYGILGYGLTNRLDIHGYYSYMHQGIGNYYGGLFYQFLDYKYFDLATAIGIRMHTNNSDLHIFLPQLLYTVHLTDKTSIGGSIVKINNIVLNKKTKDLGTAIDIFFRRNIYANEKIIIDLSIGVFNPVLWEPIKGNWHATYSVDFKFKK